jgi:hypothetical protein
MYGRVQIACMTVTFKKRSIVINYDPIAVSYCISSICDGIREI